PGAGSVSFRVAVLAAPVSRVQAESRMDGGGSVCVDLHADRGLVLADWFRAALARYRGADGVGRNLAGGVLPPVEAAPAAARARSGIGRGVGTWKGLIRRTATSTFAP